MTRICGSRWVAGTRRQNILISSKLPFIPNKHIPVIPFCWLSFQKTNAVLIHLSCTYLVDITETESCHNDNLVSSAGCNNDNVATKLVSWKNIGFQWSWCQFIYHSSLFCTTESHVANLHVDIHTTVPRVPRGVASAGNVASLIARFIGPTWGPYGADRTQVGPMLAP